MLESLSINHEKESFLGLSTLELTKRIVGNNNQSIKYLMLRPYHYVPNRPSGTRESLPIKIDSFLSMRQQELDDWATNLGEDYNIALDSNIIMQDGSKKHLIMADLAPEKSDENLGKIKKQFLEIIQPIYGGGFFLETNRSYHYFGENIVKQDDWQDLLGRLLITSIVTVMPEGVPNIHEVVVDYRYIGHSLIRHSTGLRLTTKGKKKMSPYVIAYI